MGRVSQKRRTRALKQALGLWPNRFGRKVFDKEQRTDSSPKKNLESDFGFYNRSARPEMGLVREIIEECVANYPASEVAELISRLRSGDDVHFRSATFELFLHDALRRQGFLLTPHPDLPNGSLFKPDFYVLDPNGESFYLEAVLATEKNELDKGGEARKGAVLDTLEKSPHHNFMIIAG
ncbi:hypothetical protein [Halovibrio salipaludis]|uniref:hypothetical protein n=1 Tax=Halovibrio salipaludis TaxID=2032626 RepID=UPI00117B2895|nr:hypothetical protein [Halovibrio salipaludis]